MKFDIRSVFTSGALLAAAVLLGNGPLQAQQIKTTQIYAKGIMHEDGTRTDSVKDIQKRETAETTFDSRGVVIAKKAFMLNENGDPIQGIIYDGAGNLIARVQFFFDTLGRITEERCLNPQGEIFRRVIRQYDPSGNPLPAKAFDFNVKSPTMKPSVMDFTKVVPGPDQTPGSAANEPKQPGQKPKISTASPRITTQPAKPKPSFGAGK